MYYCIYILIFRHRCNINASNFGFTGVKTDACIHSTEYLLYRILYVNARMYIIIMTFDLIFERK